MHNFWAKCTNCGAALKLDSSLEAAVCEHCSTPFIVEKAINNYNASVNLNGPVVQLGENSLPQLLINAETFAKLKDRASLVATCKRITELYPNNEEGWWGYFWALTNAGHHMKVGHDVLARKALIIVSDPIRKSSIKKYLGQYGDWKEQLEKSYDTIPVRALEMEASHKRRIGLAFALSLGSAYLLIQSEIGFPPIIFLLMMLVCCVYYLRVLFMPQQYFNSITARLKGEADYKVAEYCEQAGLTCEIPHVDF